jgi:putative transposase
VSRDLRSIYRAPTLEAAEAALTAFEELWDARFPMISRKWRTNWQNLTPFFDYPPEIRKVMYTTNAIEALNAQLRKVNKKRGAFPNPEAVRKVLYLAIMKASERWSRPVQDWTAALNHCALVFPDRVPA